MLGLNPSPLDAPKWGGGRGPRSTAELCSAANYFENHNNGKCMSCGVVCVALKDLKKIDGAAVMNFQEAELSVTGSAAYRLFQI